MPSLSSPLDAPGALQRSHTAVLLGRRLPLWPRGRASCSGSWRRGVGLWQQLVRQSLHPRTWRCAGRRARARRALMPGRAATLSAAGHTAPADLGHTGAVRHMHALCVALLTLPPPQLQRRVRGRLGGVGASRGAAHARPGTLRRGRTSRLCACANRHAARHGTCVVAASRLCWLTARRAGAAGRHGQRHGVGRAGGPETVRATTRARACACACAHPAPHRLARLADEMQASADEAERRTGVARRALARRQLRVSLAAH